MSNRDDLEAIGISDNNYNNDNGYMHEKTNIVAKVIKILAIITGLGGAGYGFLLIDKSDFFVIYIVASIISAIFIYALGEIIQKLQNIEDKIKS